MRTCSRCGIAKPTDMFYMSLKRVDRLEAACKACRKPKENAPRIRKSAILPSGEIDLKHLMAQIVVIKGWPTPAQPANQRAFSLGTS